MTLNKKLLLVLVPAHRVGIVGWIRITAFLAMLPAVQTQAATVYQFAGDRPSWAYRLKVGGKDVPVTAFPNVDAAAYEQIAAENAKIAKWLAPEARYVGVHYAHLAASGDLDVELTVSEPIRRFTIHPKRRKVQAAAKGKLLRFKLDESRPRYLIIEINELPPFCLIVDPPEENVPSPTAKNVVDASKFLTDPTGRTDQTDGFAKAVAAVAGSGKILYVPAGVYLTGALKIHKVADLNIYLAPGCLIRTKTSPPGKNVHSLGISIDRCKNIKIFGRGCLDQQAYENFAGIRNDYRHREESDLDPEKRFGEYRAVPALSQGAVLLMRSQNVEVDGLMVRNGRNFNFNIIGCSHVALRNCKVLTPPACVPEWTDGINVVATNGLRISGFFACCNDDCFAWGNIPDYGRFTDLARSQPLRHCSVSNMVGWNTRANAIRLGWYGNASPVGIDDILFHNCDFCGMEACGILVGSLKENPAAAKPPPRYGKIIFCNCGFDCVRIHGRPFGSRKVRIDRLEFQGIVFDVSPKDWIIEGAEPGAIGLIRFHNLTIGDKKVADLKKAGIRVKNVDRVIVN